MLPHEVRMAAGNVSCLSVFGLSDDASEREVHILFSGCPGYLRNIVVPGKVGQKPYAFVQFDSPDNAFWAIEARTGTTWEEGSAAVSMEIAKRDIPGHFSARQAVVPAWEADLWPPRKRFRAQAAEAPEDGAEGPRTLHLGGLPSLLQQEELDAFLQANFQNAVTGSCLTSSRGKGGAAGRAFVGFASHLAAAEAQHLLQGFKWDGSVLHAEWARSEFNPDADRHKGHSREKMDGWPVPPTVLQAATRPVGARGSGRRTLHFTNLPTVSRGVFDTFMASTFPGQVAAANFKDAQDGRPPVAWVLFHKAEHADLASTHNGFEWEGMQVNVQYARTELDPSKSKR